MKIRYEDLEKESVNAKIKKDLKRNVDQKMKEDKKKGRKVTWVLLIESACEDYLKG